MKSDQDLYPISWDDIFSFFKKNKLIFFFFLSVGLVYGVYDAYSSYKKATYESTVFVSIINKDVPAISDKTKIAKILNDCFSDFDSIFRLKKIFGFLDANHDSFFSQLSPDDDLFYKVEAWKESTVLMFKIKLPFLSFQDQKDQFPFKINQFLIDISEKYNEKVFSKFVFQKNFLKDKYQSKIDLIYKELEQEHFLFQNSLSDLKWKFFNFEKQINITSTVSNKKETETIRVDTNIVFYPHSILFEIDNEIKGLKKKIMSLKEKIILDSLKLDESSLTLLVELEKSIYHLDNDEKIFKLKLKIEEFLVYIQKLKDNENIWFDYANNQLPSFSLVQEDENNYFVLNERKSLSFKSLLLKFIFSLSLFFTLALCFSLFLSLIKNRRYSI